MRLCIYTPPCDLPADWALAVWAAGKTGVSGTDGAQQSTGGTTSVGQQLQQQFQERENEVAAQRTAFERRQKRRKVWAPFVPLVHAIA